MKRLLLIVALVLAVAILGIGAFVLTFDADRYRPLLVSKLQAALGRPVKLERLSLGWRRGIAITLQGLTVEERAPATGEPLLQMESASAVVPLLPLLRKKVRVASIIFTHPRVHALRDAQGRVNLLGLAAAAAPGAASGRTAGEGTISFNVGSIRIEQGTLHWTDAMASPPTDLWVNALDVTVTHIAPGQPMTVHAQGAFGGESRPSAEGRGERQNVELGGRVTLPATGHAGSIEEMVLAMERIPLEQLLPPAAAGSPQLRGILTLKLQGGVSTLEGPQLARSISGDGQLQLTEPVVENLNILRAVFEKFSMIPGLVEKLESSLPPDYQAKLAARDTVFAPIALAVRCDSGVLRFDDLRLRTETFELSGSGLAEVDGAFNMSSQLRIDPALSTAIVKSVNELQALADDRGALLIPVAIRGRVPRVAVMPDVRYIASKVFATKAVDLVGELMRRGESADGAQPQAGAGQPESAEEDLLGHFLKKALNR